MNTQENESDIDPFLCTCGPCKRFWKDNFNNAAELLQESSSERATQSGLCASHQKKMVKIGDRVLVQGSYTAPSSARYRRTEVSKSATVRRTQDPPSASIRRSQAFKSASIRGLEGIREGTVKFVGVVDDSSIAPQLYVGVKLDDNVNSTHNGVYKGKRYFHCPRGHGAMVRYTEVIPLKQASKVPPLEGNYMFPSWDEVKKRRGERHKRLIEIYKNAGIDPPPSIVPQIPGSAVRPRQEPLIHVSDPYDIGLKDRERKAEREKKQREAIVVDKERQEMRKIREQFGGRADADRMAQTLLKLQQAYKEGLAISRKKATWDIDSDRYTDDED